MLNATFDYGKPAFFKSPAGEYVSVEYDPYPDNPRHYFHNLGTFYTWSSSFVSIDRCPYPSPESFVESVLGAESAEHLESMQDVLRAMHAEGHAAMGIYRYEHGSVKYAIGDSNPFDDRWDSGAAGFSFVHRDLLFEEGLTQDQAVAILEEEMKDYSAWANGEVMLVNFYDERGEGTQGGLNFYGLDSLEAAHPGLEPIEVDSTDGLALYVASQSERMGLDKGISEAQRTSDSLREQHEARGIERDCSMKNEQEL